MNGFGLLLLILAVLMVAANYMHEGRYDVTSVNRSGDESDSL